MNGQRIALTLDHALSRTREGHLATNGLRIALALAGALFVTFAANAQQGINAGLGRHEFHNRCAPCHGSLGKGDGDMANSLVKRPADLTILARQNNGTFPADRVRAIIDGRSADIAAHGKREMPIWGQEYRAELADSDGAKASNPEVYVKGRIDALLSYIASIQIKSLQ